MFTGVNCAMPYSALTCFGILPADKLLLTIYISLLFLVLSAEFGTLFIQISKNVVKMLYSVRDPSAQQIMFCDWVVVSEVFTNVRCYYEVYT